MHACAPETRRQASLRDVLVTAFTVALVVGLLLPCVLKLHEASRRARCLSNLQQLGFACHSFNATYHRLPPVSGHFTPRVLPVCFPPPGYILPGTDASLFWWMLPFIGQDDVFQLDQGNPSTTNPHTITAGALTANIRTFVCLADPTPLGTVPSTTSYAANVLVFGRGDFSGSAAVRASIPATFVDGTATTILFVERYQNCWDPSPSANPTDPQQWPAPGVNIPCLWGANVSDFLPTATAPLDKQQPAIGIHPYITAGNQGTADGYNPAWARPCGYDEQPTTFQLRPRYSRGAAFPELCVAGGAQSAHASGMTVCLADGSTRVLGLGANNVMRSQDSPFPTTTVPPIQTIFNALLTPAGGETIPAEF
jgi:hypothetical protein